MPNETPREQPEKRPPSPEVAEELAIIADLDACDNEYLRTTVVSNLEAMIDEHQTLAAEAAEDGDMETCDQESADAAALRAALVQVRRHLMVEDARAITL